MKVHDKIDWMPSEMEAIEQLKNRLQKEIDEEMYENNYMFYRFLKARDFDLDQAEIMLRKHLQWRKIYDVDNIIENYKPPEVLESYLPFSKVGFDKEGSICRYVPLGIYDIRGLLKSAKRSDIDKTLIQWIEMDEKVMQNGKTKKEKLPGYVYIYNMKNFSLALATDKKAIEYAFNFALTYLDNYPERLKAIFFINTSPIFQISFAIFKSIISGNLMRKIHIYGTNQWKEDISKLFNRYDLPVFLGGAKADPDGNPLCKTFINHGDPVPLSYYFKNNKYQLSDKSKGKKLILPRASSSEIPLHVPISGSHVKWEFQTNSNDISFGVSLKESYGSSESITQVLPLHRIDLDGFIESGTFRCDKAGTYIFLFDNSNSWIRSKEIFYEISVSTPNEYDTLLEDGIH